MHVYSACYIRVSMILKKEARQVKKKFFEFKKEEYRDRIKNSGDKIGIPDGLVIYWLGDAVAFVLRLRRHASTSPILLQRYPSITAVPMRAS